MKYRNCIVCGTEFPPRRPSDTKATCSARCMVMQRRIKAQEKRTCRFCGKEYFGLRGRRMIFCSYSCNTSYISTPEQVKRLTDPLRGALKTKPGQARGKEHTVASEFSIKSPDGKTYQGRNLLDFVRENPSLFDKADVEWFPVLKTKPNNKTCRAYKGLVSALTSKRFNSAWKGWVAVSHYQPYR